MHKKTSPFKKGQLLELEIKDAAFGGKGISKIETPNGDFVFFVLNTIPGQKVLAKIDKLKKNYGECKLVEIISPASDEQIVPYQKISGAPFITLPIHIQKQYKLKTSLELFKRIGKITHPENLFETYISSPKSFHYRNKMEYAFSAIGFDIEKKQEFDGFALGFKKRGTWWIVENLNKDSGMFDKTFEDKLIQLRAYFINTGLPAWHPPKKTGFYRHLIVRKSHASNQLLIKLVTSSTNIERFDKKNFVDKLLALYGDRIAGVLHTINDDIGDNAHNRMGKDELLYGNPVIQENLLGLSFEMSMESFFQTNPSSAELLYQKALDYLLIENDFKKTDVILDLFCGTGTITQLVAKKTGLKVIGVDIVEEAINNAKENAKNNNIDSASFYALDVKKFLMEFPEFKDNINSIILDPPRAGIAPKALKRVIALNAQRIVYISCNPATQARDTEILMQNHYEPVKLSLVDQFPHTAHIESVILFKKSVR